MKKSLHGVVAGAITAGILTLTPAVAHAEPRPTGCTSGIGYRSAYAWAHCSGGAGYVQAVATCSNGSAEKKVTGPWVWVVGTAAQSEAHCPSSHKKAVGHSYNIKTS